MCSDDTRGRVRKLQSCLKPSCSQSLFFVIIDVGVSFSRRAAWWSSGKNVGQATQIFSSCFVNKVSTQLRCLICGWMSMNDLKVKLNSVVKQSIWKDTWTSHRAKHSPEVSPAVCKTAKIGPDAKLCSYCSAPPGNTWYFLRHIKMRKP